MSHDTFFKTIISHEIYHEQVNFGCVLDRGVVVLRENALNFIEFSTTNLYIVLCSIMLCFDIFDKIPLVRVRNQ